MIKIKTLWRQPDTMSLWGLPFRMNREIGQEPRHLWEAGRKSFIWLGSPGWFGSMTEAEQAEVKAFLAQHEGNIPLGPGEWDELPEE